MIPALLIRTVPANSSDEAERFWSTACELHRYWDHVTLRDPIDPAGFPLTSPYWHLADTGAQFAGLIRLEALWHDGGFYLDSDLELFRPLGHLQVCGMVGTWEDDATVPDWFLAAEPHHPVIGKCITEALRRITDRTNSDWRTGHGAWSTGPGVTTQILPNAGVTLLAPNVLAPYHYTELHREHEPHHVNPVCLGAHRWRHSWANV